MEFAKAKSPQADLIKVELRIPFRVLDYVVTSSLGSYTTINWFSHWSRPRRIGSLLAYVAPKGCRWGCGVTQGFRHVVSFSVEEC
jgi:hypothetical protein